MQQNKELFNELGLAKDKIQLDEYVKRIISQKCVLSRILKATAREFKKFSLEEIEGMIEPDVEIFHTPLRPLYQLVPGQSNRILGDNTEDKVPNEGANFYDIRFHVYLSGSRKKIPIKLLINIEAQMISAQLGTEFTDSRYDKIKKVYSIWICMNAPKKVGNAMAEFSIHKKNLIGKIRDGRKHYDKLSVIIICLNEKCMPHNKGIHQFLNIILSKKLPPAEKQQQLERNFDMKLTETLRKDVSEMCNFGDAIEREGIRKGRRKGKREGKRELNRLNQFLIRDNRIEDLIRATSDFDFQDKLFREYGLDMI